MRRIAWWIGFLYLARSSAHATNSSAWYLGTCQCRRCGTLQHDSELVRCSGARDDCSGTTSGDGCYTQWPFAECSCEDQISFNTAGACAKTAFENISSLDRHSVTCESNSALASLQLAYGECNISSAAMQYLSTCLSLGSSLQETERSTDCDAAWGAETLYLERHTIACGAGEFLSAFHTSQSDCGELKSNHENDM